MVNLNIEAKMVDNLAISVTYLSLAATNRRHRGPNSRNDDPSGFKVETSGYLDWWVIHSWFPLFFLRFWDVNPPLPPH